jgi:hypothetical protein
MEQRLHRLEIMTHGPGLVAVTDQVCGWTRQHGIATAQERGWAY